jgi:hypothetical protein
VTASPPSVFGCHRGLFTIAPPVGCRSALSRGPGAAGSRPDHFAALSAALLPIKTMLIPSGTETKM